jgi:hypothetical protein
MREVGGNNSRQSGEAASGFHPIVSSLSGDRRYRRKRVIRHRRNY